MLIDRWRPDKHDRMVSPAAVTRFVENRFKTRRFQFSDEVTFAIADQMRENPNHLLENYQFAVPPGDNCYLEFNVHKYLDRLGALTTRHIRGDKGADENIGFLIVKGIVNVMVSGSEDGHIMVMPTAYRIDPAAEIPPGYFKLKFDDQDINDLHDWAKAAHMLGSTIQNDRSTITQELLDDLNSRYDQIFDNTMLKRSQVPGFVRMVMSNNMGEVRNLLSLMLWLNQPKLIDSEHVPASRKIIKGRVVAQPEYHVLRLRPDHSIIRSQKFFHGLGTKKRRHEVLPFWRNHNRDDSCEHHWPAYPDIRGHFHCQKCKQFRVRVKQHERGDAALGFVKKDYYV